MLYPKATLRLLPENESALIIAPTQFIVHSAVDAPGPSSLFPYFARHDVNKESTFFVKLDGEVEQYMDSNRKADANNLANIRAISVETEDEGNPDEIPWTANQVGALFELMTWAHDKHAIPYQVCPAWDKPGFGYHSMWGAPSPWTTVKGKTCPGIVRIEQWNRIVVPWLNSDTVQPEEPEMRIVRNSKGSYLLVTGSASVLIDNSNDVTDFERSGVPVITVSDTQFKRFEIMRVA